MCGAVSTAKAGLLQRIKMDVMDGRIIDRFFMNKSLNPAYGFVKKIVGQVV
jgi:hypothetical protein